MRLATPREYAGNTECFKLASVLHCITRRDPRHRSIIVTLCGHGIGTAAQRQVRFWSLSDVTCHIWANDVEALSKHSPAAVQQPSYHHSTTPRLHPPFIFNPAKISPTNPSILGTSSGILNGFVTT